LTEKDTSKSTGEQLAGMLADAMPFVEWKIRLEPGELLLTIWGRMPLPEGKPVIWLHAEPIALFRAQEPAVWLKHFAETTSKNVGEVIIERCRKAGLRVD